MRKKLCQWQVSFPSVDRLFGEDVSSVEFMPEGWYDAVVPGTIVGHLADAEAIPDPYYGTQMRDIVGYKKTAIDHFAWNPMPKDSPFRFPFWYRTVVSCDDVTHGQRVWLKFHGVNFRASIWINGKRIASDGACAGTYRQFDIDVTRWILRHHENVIAVELTAQRHDELGITFIDWSPVPSDDSAGIWRPVELYTTGPVALKDVCILPVLSADFRSADVQFSCRIVNNSAFSFDGFVRVTLHTGEVLSVPISIASMDEQELILSSEDYSQLHTEEYDLWWSWDMGEQPLYQFLVELVGADEFVSDTVNLRIGFREIRSEINAYGSREFCVNGRPILIRGAAWAPDLLLREDTVRDTWDLAYIRQMNFNTVRFEGMLGTDHFWEECDRLGVLVFAGWPCCTHWEQWKKWKPDDYTIAEESLKSQILRLRNHACFAAWFYGSDYPPIPKVERTYLSILKKYAPNLVTISNASDRSSVLTGKTGVKMSGPYNYVPPRYWYDRAMPGFANSFNTETSPDASLPRYESVCKMMLAEECFVGSPSWNHHAGLASFRDTEIINRNVEQRYGVSRDNLEAFLTIAQVFAYESWRAMFEAYGRFFPEGTGVVAWMLNGFWPKMFWQLYDYWMVPTGGFYAARKACESVHVQYSYDDDSIWTVNSRQESVSGTIQVKLYDQDSVLSYSETFSLELAPYERREIIQVTNHIPISDIFFLELEFCLSPHEVYRNFYWLSSQKDVFASERKQEEWFYWPVTKIADFSALSSLPTTSLLCEQIESVVGTKSHTFVVQNCGKTIAAAIQFDIVDSSGELVYPLLWSDNMLWLTPGSKEMLTATFLEKLPVTPLKLRARGLNCCLEDMHLAKCGNCTQSV